MYVNFLFVVTCYHLPVSSHCFSEAWAREETVRDGREVARPLNGGRCVLHNFAYECGNHKAYILRKIYTIYEQ